MINKVQRLLFIFLSVIIFIYAAVFIWLNVSPAKLGMSSDTANIGICAKIFWQSGSLSPATYIGYTDSGFFSLATLGTCVYGLTGNIWYAQCVPLVVITLAILAAAIYMMKGIEGCSGQDVIFMLAIILAFPPGWYQQYTTFLFLAAYSLCIVSMFWLLGDFFRIVNGTLKHKWLHLGIQLLFALLHGLNSSRWYAKNDYGLKKSFPV